MNILLKHEYAGIRIMMGMQENRMFKIHLFCFVALVVMTVFGPDARAGEIIDMAGRSVTVPDEIRKVYCTSPPSTYLVVAMDPGLLAGLNFSLNPSERRLLDPRLQQLPVIGGWFGQGRTPNLETLMQVGPDIIVDSTWQETAVGEKIEQVLKPLGIPVVHVSMDHLSDYPAVFQFLGQLLNRQERAGVLSRYAQESLDETSRVRAAIPEENRITVYYAEGADGLNTECHASLHAELIHLSGGRNVHRCSNKRGYGMQKMSMEQLLYHNPQVIVSHDASFLGRVAADLRWKNIRAVQDGRVYRIPKDPLNWFDRPPSFMRLLGVRWLTNKLYPSVYPLNIAAETRYFYKLFLNVSLDDAAVRELLQP